MSTLRTILGDTLILRADHRRDQAFPVAYLRDIRDGKGYPQSRLLCLHLGVARMTKAKRERRERTDNYHLLQQWCRTPEQRLYEGIRPITLFGTPLAEHAQETGLAESSL